ncbi:PREDICTED: TMV resistance protein N-like [Prunus mume]|uniref:TMV resistance protein N-like n=1 Tax=Prunus mume TaxID=102107 RepID=A0ABM0P033_PRUMU|nr:PREDICTED: TMV resistance protein N-like [Prunus mume]
MALVKAADPQTSSSNASRYCRYHVFLSFRSQDTRKTFTDHLYTALVNAGFRTFRDDDEVERGEGIKPELQKAIKHSRTSVIVFSKDYASSRWCLNELVMLMMILECKRTSPDYVVLPVFYDVDPSHVRNQTGSLARAIARHQKSQHPEKVKAWKDALAEVADLAGMVLQNQADGHESKFINKIVQVIGEKLRRRPLSVPHIMIGMHSRVNELNLWLQDGSDDVGILVIYGMSGIGKTTIAKSVYNSNFGRFGGSSFLENIKEVSQQPNGLVQIQTQLLSNILNGRKMRISNVSEGLTEIEDAISSKRVLLVLDDVDHMDQLDAVLRMKDQFCPGSKIIITTRCARLLKVHQVTKVHKVETLHYKESLELFSWHAFGQDHPIEGYIEYSQKIVHHCGGLPLALKVLGSSMYSEDSIDVWKSALQKLEAIPNGEIVNKLRVSYDSLPDDHDRNLFLHIACFFIGKDKDYIVNILDACDFYTIVGIQNLIDRCLVSIDVFDNVHMHDMIRGMGREIVRLESEKPWKRSRVWQHKDAFNILTKKNGTDSIEGLVLDMHMHPRNSHINSTEIVLGTNAFTRMHELKLLHLSHVQLNGSYAEFCTGLRWLCWNTFPLDSIPTDFPLGSLIVLEMQYSSLRQVFKETKCLSSLKILDLSHSHSLTETTDFSFCPNLEKLILVDCEGLVDVNGSIGNLERLVYLSMKDCKNLRMLPEKVFMLNSLETLIISGCTNLNELSIEMLRNMESLKVLEIDEIPITQLWRGISSCIWSSLPCSLVNLSVWGCNLSDDTFPRDFSNLSSLRRLNVGNNPICSLPNCIQGLTRLDELSFSNCTRLKSLVGLPEVGELSVVRCISLEKVTYQCLKRVKCFHLGDNRSLVEWEGSFKVEPIGRVDVDMINLLGLCNLESLAPIRIQKPYYETEGLYEYGIFSTFFAGNEVPGQFSHKSTKSPISFTVPLRDYYRGLKVFAVTEHDNGNGSAGALPGPIMTRVRNKSKGLKWIYCPRCYGIPGEGEDMIWLSLWKLEEQVHLEGGDEVVVSVIMQPWLQVKEFGIQLQEKTVSTESSYYPCVVSGDLYQYQPGVYLLSERYEPPLDPIWFNKILGDSDDEDTTDKEEEKHYDQTIGATTGSNNTGSLRGWKGIITAACFFLTLFLITRSSLSHKKKRQSTGRG